MNRPTTFRAVQELAAQAGLVMSREAGTRHIRLRCRNRARGSNWTVVTLAEALDMIARHSGCERSEAA